MKRIGICSGVLGAVGCLTVAMGPHIKAQETTAAPATAVRPMMSQPEMDKKFVHKAAEGGMAEVKLGQLAAQKGSNPDVKAFGQKMSDDHTTLNNNMKPIADRLGVMTPDHLNKKDQALYDKLSGLSGDAFDKAYVSDMVTDHRKDLHEFRHESMMAADPELKTAVMSGEKVIAEHYKMVNGLAKEVGVVVATPMPMHKMPMSMPPAQ